MRTLIQSELSAVSGGEFGGGPIFTPPEEETETKNNNGYGNGAESGPAPGRSGLHNPTLIEDNLGPLGVR
jgi:hypothetical protein